MGAGVYAGRGLLLGLGLSVFFKRKGRVVAYGTGFGLGLALQKNGHGLFSHIWAQK